MMCDDLERLTKLMIGSDPFWAKSVVGSLSSVTAAVISKPKLFVFTVTNAGTHRASINAARSRVFELADRSAGALQSLHTALSHFTARARIKRIFLRVSNDGGTFAAHPRNFKMEAALQLIDQLSVTFVNTQSVSAWASRTAPTLPSGVVFEPGYRWRTPQRNCVEAALFVAAHADQPRFFSDGSGQHE